MSELRLFIYQLQLVEFVDDFIDDGILLRLSVLDHLVMLAPNCAF